MSVTHFAKKNQRLTLVDPTKFQTKEDSEIIRNLIESYLLDRRTIILYDNFDDLGMSALTSNRAVMDGRNNLANQEIFRMARGADPKGLRTVGVITKCDALQEGEELGVRLTPITKIVHLPP